MSASDQAPWLKATKGHPTPQELAAVTALVAAIAAQPAAPGTAPRSDSRWGDPSYQLRHAATAVLGGWGSTPRN